MSFPGTITASNGITWNASGINAPSSKAAGDDSIWYGITMKRSTGGIFYCVWREAPAGVYELRWHGPDKLHRGTMQVDGTELVVTAYRGEGDNQPTDRIAILGYVPLSSGIQGPKGDPGLTGPQGPQGLRGPKGDPGDSGSGGILGEADRKALDWLKTWLGPLLP